MSGLPTIPDSAWATLGPTAIFILMALIVGGSILYFLSRFAERSNARADKLTSELLAQTLAQGKDIGGQLVAMLSLLASKDAQMTQMQREHVDLRSGIAIATTHNAECERRLAALESGEAALIDRRKASHTTTQAERLLETLSLGETLTIDLRKTSTAV